MKIYAYALPAYPGCIKVGESARDFAPGETPRRVIEQRTGRPEREVLILTEEAGYRPDGREISDHMVHAELTRRGFRRRDGEWFECEADDVRDALVTLRTGKPTDRGRNLTFGLRPEQEAAVAMTARRFMDADRPRPRMLWNAKMRFGKTFTTYQLARRMGMTRILVLTYKPAVQTAWEEDLRRHVDFSGWRFVRNGETAADPDDPSPLVWFTSIQALLGKGIDGEMRTRFDALRLIEWDMVVIDEYHFGAWRDAARDVYDAAEAEVADADDASPDDIPVRAKNYLYLSGTPFKALASGEFMEDEIFNWTYPDEQRAKAAWEGPGNPYISLPEMRVMTYRLPDDLREVARKEDMGFDLNEFFRAEKRDGVSRFVHEREVQRWLEMLRGRLGHYQDASHNRVRPPLPYEDMALLEALRHTVWFLPGVLACEAMRDMLASPANAAVYGGYRVILAAGPRAGMGAAAKGPVDEAIGNDPEASRSITLSCGKLMTGVSVPAWGGIMMLRGITSPEGYFQAAFRVQTPWVKRSADGSQRVIKPICYVFDFDPNRALALIADYNARIAAASGGGVEDGIRDLLRFMPVLCYEGSSMNPVNASDLLDFAISGIGAGMLARRWQSAAMVNLDASTLSRLLDRPEVIRALSKIEAFRNLNRNVEMIISSDHTLRKAKAEGRKPNPKERRVAEKADAIKKDIRENLLKFITRIPLFMYLTDEREESLIDVIRNIEPELFTRVTGIGIQDFNVLCDLGVFNREFMNGAILAFRRFEEPSLVYAGGTITDRMIGLMDVSAPRAVMSGRLD